MGLPVVTVASGGLPIVETTRGAPVTEAANGRGLPVTKVVGKPGLPVTFETIGVAPAFATLDGTSSNATLSNGNLTVTHSNTSTGGGRSAAFKTSGKYYFEVTINTKGGQQDAFAMTIAAADYLTYDVVGNFGVYVKLDTTFFNVQNVYVNAGGISRLISPIANGSVICFAVDLDLKKTWIRVNNGLWLAQSTATENPAAGLGGAVMGSASGYGPILVFEGSGTAAGHSYTINLGQSAFVYSVPVGFTSGWPP